MEVWISIATFWFENMSEQIDVSSVFLAVALSIYAVIRKRNKAMALMIIVSFVGFYFFSQELQNLRGIEGYIFLWFSLLFIKDAYFGFISHLIDRSSRLPVAYAIQVIITLIVLLIINQQLATDNIFKMIILPIWSISYVLLMVLKLTIYFSETNYGKGRPLTKYSFNFSAHIPAPLRRFVPNYSFFDQPDCLLQTKKGA